MTTTKIPNEIPHDTIRPPSQEAKKPTKAKKKSAKPKTNGSGKPSKKATKNKPTTKRASSKKTTSKRSGERRMKKSSGTRHPKSLSRPRGGTSTKTERNGQTVHVMSVHIPLPMLAKLDKRCLANAKTGKGETTRSAFAVQA